MMVLIVFAGTIALVMSAVAKVRRSADRLYCANNLKQIAYGIINSADTTPIGQRSRQLALLFPAGTVPNATLKPEERLSWFVELLPFVGQDHVYQHFDTHGGWQAPANAAAVQTPVYIFKCPNWERHTEPKSAILTPYLGVAGVGTDAATIPAGDPRAGIFSYDRRTDLADIKDGLSNTMMILESAHDNGSWAQGGPSTVRSLDPDERPYLGVGRPFGGTHLTESTMFNSGQSFGCNMVMADASIRFIVENIRPELLEALATVAGGESLEPDW